MAAEDARLLKCPGCGQVGALVEADAHTIRQRRLGFYRLEGKENVIACCRCQQTQRGASSLDRS